MILAERTPVLVAVDAETLTRVLLAAFAEATLHVLTSGTAEDAIEVVERLIDAFSNPERKGVRR